MNRVQRLPAELDERSIYGFPVMPPREQRDLAFATEYAAGARQRNKSPCNCEMCRKQDMWPAVEAILSARGKT